MPEFNLRISGGHNLNRLFLPLGCLVNKDPENPEGHVLVFKTIRDKEDAQYVITLNKDLIQQELGVKTFFQENSKNIPRK